MYVDRIRSYKSDSERGVPYFWIEFTEQHFVPATQTQRAG